MPTLPDKNALGRRPVPNSNRPIVNTGVDNSGEIMQDIGATIGKVGNVIQNKVDDFDYSVAKSNFLLNNARELAAREQDTEYDKMPEVYRTNIMSARDAAMQGIRNPALRQKFALEAESVIGGAEIKLQDVAFTKRKQNAKERINIAGDEAFEAYSLAKSESERNLIKQNLGRLLTAGKENNFIDGNEAYEYVKKWDAKAAKAQVLATLQTQPQKTIEALEAKVSGKGSQALAVNFTAGAKEAIDAASDKYGVSKDWMYRVADIESGGQNIKTKVKNASSAGLFQFTNGTAKQYGLSDKYDMVANADAAARLYLDNKTGLEKSLGREVTEGELYLAHQQGVGGASKLLSNPNKKAIDVVGKDAVLNNGGTADMSAGDFAAKWVNKYNKRGSATSGEFSFLNDLDYDDATELLVKVKKDAAKMQKEEAFSNVQKLVDTSMTIAQGGMSWKEFTNQPNLTDADRVIGAAAILGDKESLTALNNYLQQNPSKYPAQGFDEANFRDRMLLIKERYQVETKAGNAKAAEDALREYSTLMQTTNIAKVLNSSKGGSGLNNTSYKKINEELKAEIDALYESENSGNDLAFFRSNPKERIFEKIDSITGNKDIRRKLFQFAYFYADEAGVNLSNEDSVAKAPKVDGMSWEDDLQKKVSQYHSKLLGIKSGKAAGADRAIGENGNVNKLLKTETIPADKTLKVDYEIMVDKDGNKAKVYKDGRVEEIN